MLTDHGSSGYDEVGAYYKEIRGIQPLTKEQEVAFGKRIKADPEDREAREALIKHNLGLPVHIAKKYVGCGIPFSDLIQEGNIGLINATNTYDPSKNIRFFSYAYPSVRWSICLAIGNKSRLVRLSRTARKLSTDIRRGVKQNKDTLKRQMKFLKVDTIEDLANLSTYREVSLEWKNAAGRGLVDLLRSKGSEQQTKELEREESNEKLKDALISFLSILPEEEREIIESHYGLFGKKPCTLNEIGKEYGHSVQNIFSKCKRAVRKLSKYKENLFDYV